MILNQIAQGTPITAVRTLHQSHIHDQIDKALKNLEKKQGIQQLKYFENLIKNKDIQNFLCKENNIPTRNKFKRIISKINQTKPTRTHYFELKIPHDYFSNTYSTSQTKKTQNIHEIPLWYPHKPHLIKKSKRLKEINNQSATNIQKIVRSRQVRNQSRKETNETIKIQSIARTYLAKKKLESQQKATNEWVNVKLNTTHVSLLLSLIASKSLQVPTELSLNQVLDSLIAKGANVNAYIDGRTPLYWAIQNNDETEDDKIELAKLLIKHGADVNDTYFNWDSPLDLAVKNNKFKLAKLLLDHHANVNATHPFTKNTALIYATDQNFTEVIKLLVDYGADINTKNDRGNAAIMFAAANNSTEIIKLLVDYGANINTKDNQGNAALMVAAKNNSTEALKLLVEYGADINTKDNQGNTALELAKKNEESIESVQILEIAAHFNESPSIDSLHEELVTIETKQYYIDNKKTLDPLFKFRKIARLARKIVTAPNQINKEDIETLIKEIEENKEIKIKVFSLILHLMKNLRRCRFLPAAFDHTVQNYDGSLCEVITMAGLPFLSLKTASELKVLDKEHNKRFTEHESLKKVDLTLEKSISALVSNRDGLSLLIEANKKAVAEAEAKASTNIQKIVRGHQVRKNNKT